MQRGAEGGLLAAIVLMHNLVCMLPGSFKSAVRATL